MIQAQNNPLRFYANKLSRQWGNTENERRLVTYPMYLDGATYKCKVPPFGLITNSTQSGYISNVVTKVYNCEGTEVFSSSAYSAQNKGTYTQILFAGADFINDDQGNYEIKVTITSSDNGTEIYYSDFFEWSLYLDDKLKIKVESAKIRLGDYEYEMVYTIHEFYLDLKPLSSNTYLKEDANETDAVTLTNSGSSALLRSYLIKANEPIFMFLRTLRILLANGSVKLTYKFIEYQALDIVAEIESDLVNADLMNVKIEFKVLAEVASVYNG